MAGELIIDIVCFVTGEKYLTIYCRKKIQAIVSEKTQKADPDSVLY